MGSYRDFLLGRKVEPILAKWDEFSPQGVWRQFTQMIEAGIDDVYLGDIRRLYSVVVAHQVYALTEQMAYDGALNRIAHNSRAQFAAGFEEGEGSVDTRRQRAFLRAEYLVESSVNATYREARDRAGGIATGMGLIAAFLSRELSARAMEIERLARDTE